MILMFSGVGIFGVLRGIVAPLVLRQAKAEEDEILAEIRSIRAEVSALRGGTRAHGPDSLRAQGRRPPRHLLPLSPLRQIPIIRCPKHSQFAPTKIFCIGPFARFDSSRVFAAAFLVSQLIPLSLGSIACLDDEAYVYSGQQSLTQDLPRVEREKAEVEKTQSSFALFASKKSRLAYKKAIDAVLETEGEIRQKLVPGRSPDAGAVATFRSSAAYLYAAAAKVDLLTAEATRLGEGRLPPGTRLPHLPPFRPSTWVDKILLFSPERGTAVLQATEREARAFSTSGKNGLLIAAERVRAACLRARQSFLDAHWSHAPGPCLEALCQTA